MSELLICRICLATGVKMYRLDRFQLQSYYEEVMAMKVCNSDNLPNYFCYECAMLLHKFHKFKEKCYHALKAFKELTWKGPSPRPPLLEMDLPEISHEKLTRKISYKNLATVDRQAAGVMPILQIINNMKRSKFYKFEDNSVKVNHTDTIKTEQNIADVGCYEEICTEDVKALHSPGEVEICNSPQEMVISQVAEEEEISHSQEVEISQSLKVKEVKHEVMSIPTLKENQTEEYIAVYEATKEDIIKPQAIKYSAVTKRRTRFLDPNNWYKYMLNETQAKNLFKSRCNEQKYQRAAYKCTECYKGFSKDDMLIRHIQLRHLKSLGDHECRFCKMRFKWLSHLRIHLRQHFTVYKCLKCSFECPLENTAILHEEFHSGVTRKCIHCNIEFRHASTYYTHLRNAHRSIYICSRCGLSFVSETGLHQHRKLKHSMDSPDDEDEHTFCELCDIHFDTRDAFIEHLFHSVMHTEGLELEDEISIPNKVLGKRLKAKIAKEIFKNNDEVVECKKKRRVKRRRVKPMTCYQCGAGFETQSACMKHHVASHPGTSFYPHSERHICEICGTSLAPGSVAIHKNMHTREKVYSCDTCGRQFHSTIGLKRHFVTHTGEKRYACSLCDKRFTQSNSMKLHFRTFHLKQPYPKRNRKKKEQEAEREREMESEERSELDSLPEQNPETQTIIMEGDGSTVVQYLTLN